MIIAAQDKFMTDDLNKGHGKAINVLFWMI